jgi:hypothetical protein
MKARYFGNDEVNTVNSGPSSSAGSVRHGGPPDQLDAFLDQIGQAEGEQQFGDVAELVHRAQAEALDQRASASHQQRRQDQRGPEADRRRGVGEVRAQHVEAGVREVQHAHHAEDQRQAR